MQVVKRYNSELASRRDQLELEIRVRDVTANMWMGLYKALKSAPGFDKPQLECTINTISSSKYLQYIRRMTFIKGVKCKDENVTKQRLMPAETVKDLFTYTVNVSVEGPGKEYPHGDTSMMRFKVRLSYDIIGTGWRLDITAVRSGTFAEMARSATSIRDALFRTITPENIDTELNTALITSYEIELERTAKTPVDVAELSIVRKVFSLISPNYLTDVIVREEVRTLWELTHDGAPKREIDSIKKASNQVISLTKNVYYNEIYPPIGYYLTDKADGIRCIISATGDRMRVITHTAAEYTMTTPCELTMVDCELVNGIAWIFDVIAVGGKNVSGGTISKRITYFDEAARILSAQKEIAIKVKPFVVVTEDLRASFEAVLSRDTPYETDGIIIVSPGESYAQTRNYKWKPLDKLTIDFLAVKCPSKMLGINPYMPRPNHDLYLLFVGINHQMRERNGIGMLKQYKTLFPDQEMSRGVYYPIQFSPSVNPYAYIYYHPTDGPTIDRMIVELGLANGNDSSAAPEWRLVKIREDRARETNYFGNDFRVAETTYMNFVDKFTSSDLWRPRMGYFEVGKVDDMYSASNKYKRYVISRLLQAYYCNMRSVIDLCAGRGADLHRYQEIAVKEALFVDSDATALSELVRRKYEYGSYLRKRGGIDESVIVKDVDGMTVHTLVWDMRESANKFMDAADRFFPRGTVNGIVCNFALHYFCDSVENLTNFMTAVAGMLALDGIFMFTIMDGEGIFKLIAGLPQNGTYEVRQDGQLKYVIRRDFAGKTLSAAGQMISVKLPFSVELRQEPIANYKTIVRVAKQVGLNVDITDDFSKYLTDFKSINERLYGNLTQDDLMFIRLHRYCIMRKGKVGGRRRPKHI